MEEEDPAEPLTFEEVEELAAESRELLHAHSGVLLPRLPPTPVQAARRIDYVPFGIELPLGSLFYPCSGSDTFRVAVTDATAAPARRLVSTPCQPWRRHTFSRSR